MNASPWLLGVSSVVVFFSACGLAPSSRAAEAQIHRMMSRSATVNARSDTLSGLEPRLRKEIGDLGGYLTRSEQAGSPGSEALTLSFRVPSDKLDLAIASIEGPAVRIESRTVHGDDLTEEYVDLEGQVRNLTATRERMLGLLERATKVDEALEVNRGLGQIQDELDKKTGRAKFLEQSAALSELTIVVTAGGGAPIGSWRPLEVAQEAASWLLAILRGIANAAIVALVFSPLWAPAWWLLRRMKRRSRAAVA